MKKIIALFVTMFLFHVSLFSQNKIIDLIITEDKDIVNIVSGYFIIVDTINNKNDTVTGYYYPGRMSIKEDDFEKIIKNDKVIFYFSTSKARTDKKGNVVTYQHNYYHINYYKKWFFTTYSLLHIYTSKTKEYRKMTRDNDSDQYTYEFYSPEGFALIRARRRLICPLTLICNRSAGKNGNNDMKSNEHTL